MLVDWKSILAYFLTDQQDVLDRTSENLDKLSNMIKTSQSCIIYSVIVKLSFWKNQLLALRRLADQHSYITETRCKLQQKGIM